MARYLVVAHQTGESPELRREIERRVHDDPQAEFGVVVPATPVSHMFTWDDRETLEVANDNLERASKMITEAGGTVVRDVVGARAPIDALTDELREGPGYDAVIICTFPQGISRWLKLDLINQARKRSGLPVTHVVSQPREGGRARTEQATTGAAAETRAAQPIAGGATTNPPPAPAGQRELLQEEDIGELELPAFPSHPLPAEAQDAVGRIDREEKVSNLFRALRRNPPLVGPYLEMLHALWNESGLDLELRELAILRTAALSQSEYVWHQHVRVARENGVSDDRIAGVNRWQSTERAHYDARERAMFAFIDALAHPGSDVRHAREVLAKHMQPDAILGLTMLVGFYRMTANIALAEELETEG
ncbi:MAG: carboxymuconolactone decarboxylase family protein, partial [Dehalococcoidia bacterium]|nr:carboxymuconolactone decarboxylase family protein [Dehalococcoidia bacterium]